MDFLKKKAHLFKGPNHDEICCHFKLSKLNYPSFSWLHKPEMSAQLGDFQGAVYKNLNLFGLNLIDHQTNRSNCDELRFIRIPFNFKISTSIFPIFVREKSSISSSSWAGSASSTSRFGSTGGRSKSSAMVTGSCKNHPSFVGWCVGERFFTGRLGLTQVVYHIELRWVLMMRLRVSWWKISGKEFAWRNTLWHGGVLVKMEFKIGCTYIWTWQKLHMKVKFDKHVPVWRL